MNYITILILISSFISTLTFGVDLQGVHTQGFIPHQQLSTTQAVVSPSCTPSNSIAVISEMPKIVFPKGGVNEYEERNTGLLQPAAVLHALRELKLVKSVRDYTVIRIDGGWASEAVYKITGPKGRPGFILKALKWVNEKIVHRQDFSPTRELLNLAYLKENKVHQRLNRQINPDFPEIILNEKSFSYIDSNSMRRFVTIYPLAKGRDLVDQINWKKKGEIDSKDRKMLIRVGKSIGLMHFHLATPSAQKMLDPNKLHFRDFKTLTHKDLHLGNIIYDPSTTTVSLIDCADMAESLSTPNNFMDDLIDLFYQVKYNSITVKTEELNTSNQILESFVEGYVSAFSPEIQVALREFIMARFKTATITFHQATANHIICRDKGKRYTPPKHPWMDNYMKRLKALSNAELQVQLGYLSGDQWILEIRG